MEKENNYNCEKWAFDYNKHIIIKSIITPEFRWFSEHLGMFQGLTKFACDKCLIDGFTALSLPFKFQELTDEEIHCTLLRMGLKYVPYIELDIMPQIKEYEGNYLCPTCLEEMEAEKMQELYEELGDENPGENN